MKRPQWIICAALPRLVRERMCNGRSMCLRRPFIFALGQRTSVPYKRFTSPTPKRRYTHPHITTSSVILEKCTGTGFSHMFYRRIESPVGEVGVMCFDSKLLLQVEQIAWDEFRHLRDSTWSPDAKILRAHDNALAASQKLRAHVAECQECREARKFGNSGSVSKSEGMPTQTLGSCGS
jgi:hypothetical protein